MILRDGGNFVGTLRSFDQFGNLVLQNTIQRFFVGEKFHEKRIGVFLVRGDAISLLGQVVRELIGSLEDERDLFSLGRRLIGFSRSYSNGRVRGQCPVRQDRCC